MSTSRNGSSLNPKIESRVTDLENRYTDVGLNTSVFPISDATDSDRSDIAASSKAVKRSQEGSPLLGTVVAFSGSFGGDGNRYPIPLGKSQPDTHWVLCDGIPTNGLSIPDLRGRMILGVSSEYPMGSTGGTADSSTAVTVGPTTLTQSQMPSHRHGIAIGNNDGAWPNPNGCSDKNGTSYECCEYTGSSAPHTHNLIDIKRNGNLPPYYALSYIIRIA